MTTENTAPETSGQAHEYPLHWGWILAQGIVTVLLGGIALALAGLTTLASVYLFGGFMGAAGILQLVQTFTEKDKGWSLRISNLLIGLVYLITSVLIFIDPLAASLALTIFIASFFMVIGVIRLVQAWKNRSRGWNWLWPGLFGLINLGFGAYVIATLPVSALWLIGMMVSIELIMQGWTLIVIALAARKALNG